MRSSALVLLAFALFPLLAGPVAAQSIEEAVQVVAVEVPVQVSRDGEPLRGLTAADFEVVVQGKKQRITGFEVIDLSVMLPDERDELPPMPVSARRHFLFLFDLSFSEIGPLLRARAAVEGLLAEMHETDLAAVAIYAFNSGPRLILGFTPDREQVRLAVETLGAPKLFEGSLDPLQLTLVEPNRMAGELGDLPPSRPEESDRGRGLAGGMEEMVREHLLAMQRANEKASRADQRGQVAGLTRDLQSLAASMHAIRGRKYVVYLSQGFDSSTLFASSDAGQVAQMNRAAESGQVWDIDSEARFGSNAAQSQLDTMLEEFRRADCVIQSVDIGSAGAEDATRGKRSGTDGLFIMANETGGELYKNYNNLAEAMTRMLEKTSVSYVLTIQPKGLRNDGKFRKLRVKLKDVPGRARVVHRPGFFAPKPFSERSVTERRAGAAEAILSGREHGALPVAVLAAPFKSGPGGARVAVVAEIEGKGLLEGASGESLDAEVYGYLFDAGGRIRDLFGQQVRFDLNRVGELLSRNGMKFYGELNLPPGDYSLRLLVRNGRTGVSRLRIVPVSVPEFDGTFRLLPPLIPDPQGKWLLVREARRPESGVEAPFPFMIGDEPFLPGARPTIFDGQEARICLVAYDLGQGEVTVEGRLVATDGSESPLQLGTVEQAASTMPGSVMLVARMTPRAIEAGYYTLVVTLTDPASGRSRTSSLPLVLSRAPAAGPGGG